MSDIKERTLSEKLSKDPIPAFGKCFPIGTDEFENIET